jgi:Lon protease-like protein
MKKNKITLENIPNDIPVFPLANAIFFPGTVLPLNIFEPRYKQMTEDALSQNKFIGISQPNIQIPTANKPSIFEVGCVGIIQKHTSTPDGRYLINLEGISRFKVVQELPTEKLYRTFKVSYAEYEKDLEEDQKNTQPINKEQLLELIDKTKKFFKMFQLSTDWSIVEKVEPSQLINSLAMICPFTIGEKQRLLETVSIEERNNILNQIINFYILGNQSEINKKIH